MKEFCLALFSGAFFCNSDFRPNASSQSADEGLVS